MSSLLLPPRGAIARGALHDLFVKSALAAGLSLCGLAAYADEVAELPAMQVTATREAEPIQSLPATVSVVTAAELAALNAHDLGTALRFVAGVEAAAGGDGGPAGSVPAIWGLREFDAFLLLVDGVPYGGAFNPALTALDLTNVERIEVLRGPAPVNYGATSFVGVIHVIHYAAGESPNRVSAGGGSYGTALASGEFALDNTGPLKQSLSINGEHRGLADDAAGFDRAHLLYRLGTALGGGQARLDFDANILRQDPTSPHPRMGRQLSARVPLDANHTPSDSRIDENRFHLVAGYERAVGFGDWTTTAALTHTSGDIIRGFLREDLNDDGSPNADGYRQDRKITDIYLDTHISKSLGAVSFSYGIDALLGKGEQESENFEYYVPLDGSNRPSSRSRPVDETTELEDERSFIGLYTQGQWQFAPRWRLLAGLRLNATHEKREGEEEVNGVDTPASETRSDTKLSGSIGVSYLAWSGASGSATVYANYRDTFKPGAVDFGPEAEADILEPETSQSYEIGARGDLLSRKLHWDLSAFVVDFKNLVVNQNVNGSPALVNAGNEEFSGVETELQYELADALSLLAAYSYHDAHFEDYVRNFGGTPTQLSGRQLELAPYHLGSLGLLLAPDQGFEANAIASYVGRRFMDKRNRAPTGGYTTLDAMLGYKFGRWELRVDGYNLTDRREPAIESELGDAQYYRLPARSVIASVAVAL